jgi:hypothetical protein
VNELLGFLRAQLDEDERIAREGVPFGTGRWTAEESYGGRAKIHDSDGGCVVHDDGEQDIGTARHIALHDPGRALRDVEADRKLIRAYCAAVHYCEGSRLPAAEMGFLRGRLFGLEQAIRMRAEVYSEHPGYREEFRP